MRVPAIAPETSSRPAGAVVADLRETRRQTLELVDGLEADVLHRPLDPVMSPLVWDLGHIAAYEDLWCAHRLAGLPLLRPDLATLYDAFETPRPARAAAELPPYEDAVAYLSAVRARTLGVLDDQGPSELHELVVRHELQHTETMRQALFLGGMPGGAPAALPAFPHVPQYAEIRSGRFEVGAGAAGFAYDNERPRHEVDLSTFRIARTPVTNAAFAHFIEDGGYQRREWWSHDGWSWNRRHRPQGPLGRSGGDSAPVQHVCWYEADAFARSRGARLPTEPEWEAAAAQHLLEGVGCVWEWTATEFGGYPGFRAHPYPEYSEVFFGRGYRVLRGGSWASAPRVATRTFRNWDLPERRQIFSGIRLARGA